MLQLILNPSNSLISPRNSFPQEQECTYRKLSSIPSYDESGVAEKSTKRRSATGTIARERQRMTRNFREKTLAVLVLWDLSG
ncbi:unnamed protein product [Allacma fusca]|uniref:Uncharacterized protein n=1 Tax=Allacma fusca TaxID=39272 RepID=A0A8J2KP91_9HEXA|nr:unnamed protein product [Allacma fusca]